MKKNAKQTDIKFEGDTKTCNLSISENGKDYSISYSYMDSPADGYAGPYRRLKLDIPGGIPYEILYEYGFTETFLSYYDFTGKIILNVYYDYDGTPKHFGNPGTVVKVVYKTPEEKTFEFCHKDGYYEETTDTHTELK